MGKNRTREKWAVKNKDSVDSSHRSYFNKEKFYGTIFTERQQAIIDGEYIPNLRKLELTMLIRKAEQLGMYETAASVYNMYDYIFDKTIPQPTEEELEEARRVLDELTPDDLK